jgi:hypothetical protein
MARRTNEPAVETPTNHTVHTPTGCSANPPGTPAYASGNCGGWADTGGV